MAGDIPPCNIRIDKDGTWYYQGLPIINKNIYFYLNQCLTRDPSGKYILSMNGEKCYLEVEDTPFVIQAVDLRCQAGRPACLWGKINDGTEEALDLAALRVAADNVLYVKIKHARYEARFTRAAYYQLADFLGQDSDGYYLCIEGAKTYLKQL